MIHLDECASQRSYRVMTLLCIHTHTYTYKHTHTHIQTHTHTHAYTYTHTHTHTLSAGAFCVCARSIVAKHQALAGLGVGPVQYQALQLVASLEHYGVEWHWARDAHGRRLAIGVGAEGIAVCKDDFSLVNR